MNTGTQTRSGEQEFGGQDQFDRESFAGTSFASGQEDRSNPQDARDASQIELKYRSPANVATTKFAKGLGMFSIALGLAELLAPAQVGELIGVSPRYRTFIPALGLREIAHGVGIMMQDKPTEAVWTRVLGDGVDLAYLGAAFMGEENNKRRLIGATVAVLGVTAMDVMCAQALSAEQWSDADGNLAAPTTVGQTSGRL
jgi:hypothetical protein